MNDKVQVPVSHCCSVTSFITLISCSSNVSIASTEREKGHGWESFQFNWAGHEKTRRKRRPRAQGEGPSPHLQDFSPLLCALDQAFPQEHVVWMKQWPETRGTGCPCHCTALVQPDFGSPKPLGANESFHRDNNGQNNQPSLDNFFD